MYSMRAVWLWCTVCVRSGYGVQYACGLAMVYSKRAVWLWCTVSVWSGYGVGLRPLGAEIAGSNSAEGLDIRLLLCAV